MDDLNQSMVEMMQKLAAAEARAQKAEGELANTNSRFEKSLAKYQAQAEAAEAKVAEIQLQSEMDRALMSDGISDESAIDYIRYNYSRMQVPEGQAKPAFSDFYQGFKESKADFLGSFRPKPVEKPVEAAQQQPWMKPAPVVAVPKPVDPALGTAGKQAPTANVSTNPVFDGAALAAMSPADAVAHLRAIGLARPAKV